jgi:uncharacterized protein YcnI
MKLNKKYSVSLIAFAALAIAPAVSAHAVVSPSAATVAAYQEYTLSVPSEKDATTTSIRLLVPSGVSDVTPNVIPGWTVSTKTDSNNNVTEIDWTQGSIPTGQREDFMFELQDPANPTTLDWKVYQTYSDGSVVSWDQDPTAPNGTVESDTSGPYSITAINAATTALPIADASPNYSLNALILATIALIMALYGLVFTDHRTRN